MTAAGHDDSGQRSKVARVIEEYELGGIGAELEQRWLVDDEDRMSLRELAEYLNRKLLQSAIEASDLDLLDVDTDRVYEQLSGDEATSGERTRVRRRLERNGLAVDSVLDDFVTHQAVHTYLREYREVEQSEPTPAERRQAAVERIQKLQDRTAAVTKDTIEGLQRADIVSEGNVDVVVDIQVIYTETGKQSDVFGLIESDEPE